MRRGELIGRLAGIEADATAAAEVVRLAGVEVPEGAGLGTSTGTGVTGIWVMSELWLKRQWARVQWGFSGHGRVWKSFRVGNMAAYAHPQYPRYVVARRSQLRVCPVGVRVRRRPGWGRA